MMLLQVGGFSARLYICHKGGSGEEWRTRDIRSMDHEGHKYSDRSSNHKEDAFLCKNNEGKYAPEKKD